VPDNLHISEVDFKALPGHALIALQGPDSLAFAQAQFANDSTALALGQWQWSAWLTAKGRVIAVFMLCHVAPDTLWLILADGRADIVAAQLQRFVFRRKLKVLARSDLHIGGRFDAPTLAAGAHLQGVQDRFEFDLGTPALPRALLVSPHTFVEQPGFALQWRQADLRLGLPRLDDSAVEQWTPQQIGLDRLSAYSVKKGCYPGQEIVARTHFLGKAKRVAQLVQVPPNTPVGAELRNGDQPAGTLASVAGDLALAVLPIESEGLALQLQGVPVTLQPMLEGLSR